MFHHERFTHPLFKKSAILNLIGFLQAIGFSIVIFIVPLYLFEIFQSAEVIGQISSIAAFTGILMTIAISFLLTFFSRGILFKIGIFTFIGAILFFLSFTEFFEAAGGRSFVTIAGAILSSVLSLYLKDLSTEEDLGGNQGKYYVSINLAWLIGPIVAGYLFEFFGRNEKIILENLKFLGDGKNFQYDLVLYFALIFISLAFIVFLFAKFVSKHPHLQLKKCSNENNKHHHYLNFRFILDYFKNKYRVLSFLNILFFTVRLYTIHGFGFSILLTEHGLGKQEIGLFFGLLSVPLFLLEGFLGKILEKLGGSVNALIVGYLILVVLLSVGMFIGFENIYVFIGFFIASNIGMAIIEPLQNYQYFEGTNKANEGKYYSIHMLGGAGFKLIAPFVFGITIANYGVHNAFYGALTVFGMFLLGLIYFKLRGRI